jgi:hypothetical protein
LKCNTTGEVLVDSGITKIPCTCGGVASLVWLKAPGFGNPSKGIYPRYDVQLGMTIDSRQHEARVLKEKGLVAVPPNEFNRQVQRDQNPPETLVDKERMLDAVQLSIKQVLNREVPIEPIDVAPPEAMPILLQSVN